MLMARFVARITGEEELAPLTRLAVAGLVTRVSPGRPVKLLVQRGPSRYLVSLVPKG